MKKFLPIVVLLLGLGVLLGAYFFIKGRGADDGDEEAVPEVSFEKRPTTTLTPSDDGHWLKLRIELKETLGESLDYELLYLLPDGRTQGVPGSIPLGSEMSIERDLLLGSESRGKFTYDEGVKEGTLTLRFRNSKGKLNAKFSTDFSLLGERSDLASVDREFSYILAEASPGAFFVVMQTFGAPDDFPQTPTKGPYGVFGSADDPLPGKVTLSGGNVIGYVQEEWVSLDNGVSEDIGIFMATP